MTVIRCFVATMACALILPGCSTLFGEDGMFRARHKDYVRTGSIKQIEVPEEMRGQTKPLDPLLVIPPVDATDEFGDKVQLTEYSVPRPETMANDDGIVGVKIQKLDGRRWIFLNASTSQVWPQTQSFLSEYNVDVANSVPSEGLIESDWIQFRGDQSTKSRYRISIEKGIHPDTTEVHVLHAQFPLDTDLTIGPDFPWPETSSSAEREGWLMQELALVLANSVDNSAASLMGQNVGGEVKAQYTRVNGEPVIAMDLSYVRAWASVSHGVEADGFALYESDADLGIAYIGFPRFAEEEPGFWGSLLFWSESDQAPQESLHSLSEILSGLSDSDAARKAFGNVPGVGFGQPVADAQGYLVLLEQRGDRVIVRVRDHRGETLDDQAAKDLLRVLRSNLI